MSRTVAGKALVAKLDEIAAMPYSGVSFPWADDYVDDIERTAIEPLLPLLRAAREIDRERLGQRYIEDIDWTALADALDALPADILAEPKP